MQTTGKIIVAGSSHDGTGNDFVVARYDGFGNVDSTFFGPGFIITGSFATVGDSDDQAFALAVHTNNQIAVAGTTFNPATSTYDFAVARYTPDGDPVTSFDEDTVGGGDGKVVTPFATNDDRAYGVAFDSSGRIVAVGAAEPPR